MKKGIIMITGFIVTVLAIALLDIAIISLDRADKGRTKSDQNGVLIYDRAGRGETLVQDVAKGYGMIWEDSMYDRYLTTVDIPSLAERDDVETVYYVNQVKYFTPDQSFDNMYELYSAPEVMMNYVESVHSAMVILDGDGTAPRDGMKEVVISEEKAKKMFNLNEGKKSIGNRIKIDGEDYTITGVARNADINSAWISYEPEEEHYFMRYDPDTFEDYLKEQAKVIQELDAVDICCVFVRKKESADLAVLQKELFEQYPGSLHNSAAWGSAFDMSYSVLNKLPVLLILDGVLVLFFVIWAVVMLIFGRRKKENEKND